MPKRVLRVLARSKIGTNFLQASDEEREAMGEENRAIFEEWQAAGIKMLANWTGHLDGFSQYAILEAPDLETAWQMYGDMWQAKYRRLYDKLEFYIGWDQVPDESD